ncbi:MAG: tetratricopeptide repeat protein [Thermodesulfobacteriota bacterium]
MKQQAEKSNELLRQGTQYLLGRGARRDEKKGRELIVQAAELDNPDAMHLAYMMLAHGQGGPFDRKKAFQFLKRAAELGHLEATYILGYCYIAGGMGNNGYSTEILNQQPVPMDEEKGLKYLYDAADRGHSLAALRIAEHWEDRAEDEPEFLERAVMWYEKGVALGEPNCLIHLADFHILGKVLPKDPKKARKMYKQAAKSDDICARSTAKQRLEEFDELETLLMENYS